MSKKKRVFDKIVEPVITFTGINMAYLYGLDNAIEFVSNNIDSNEGLAILGTYGAFTAGAVYLNKNIIPFLNKKVIKPVIKKIDSAIKKRPNAKKLSWLKTAGEFGAVAGAYLMMNIPGAVGNITSDFKRIDQALARDKTRPVIEEIVKNERMERTLPEYEVRENGGPFESGAIEGMQITGYNTLYTGIKGTAPEKITIDFNQQLKKMWDKKKEKHGLNSASRQLLDTQVKDYLNGKKTTMTLDKYLDEIQESMDEVRDNLNWDKVASIEGLNSRELKLLKSIVNSLNERDLLSYGLTELMGDKNGKKNIGVLDFMLRNAGREYVELIPAMGDSYASFGLYQFTSFAIFDKGNKREGASMINKALPEDMQIRGSAIYLKGNDHHKAAIMFATHNLARIINSLNRNQLTTLENKGIKHKDDLVKIIATAHHKPRNAMNAAHRWIDNEVKYDYAISCDSGIRAYADKTGANFAALYGKSLEELTKNQKKSGKTQAKTQSKQVKTVKPQVKEGPSEEFKYVRTKKNGELVFRHIVKPKERPYSIARSFNEWDNKKGDKYREINHRNVVNKNGAYVFKNNNTIHPKDRVYILTRKK